MAPTTVLHAKRAQQARAPHFQWPLRRLPNIPEDNRQALPPAREMVDDACATTVSD